MSDAGPDERGLRRRLIRAVATLHRVRPVRVVLLGYLGYLLAGWALLCIPAMQAGEPVAAVDNLFVAASAMSTTGLVSVSTPTAYGFGGELVILLLFQLGGIGYMTLGSFIVLAGHHRLSRFRQGITRVSFSLPESFDPPRFIRNVVVFTLAIEAAGAVALFFAFRAAGVAAWAADPSVGASGDGLGYVAWAAIFHSVSAFCTAGFSVFPDSLERFRGDVAVNLIVSALSLAGAVGFIVMCDYFWTLTGVRHRVTLTTRVILHFTFWLLVIGTGAMWITDASLAELPQGERLLASWFQAMTATTTVGFNTHPIGGLALSSLMVMLVVMVIGASPSGTGGGLKTTTVSAVWATMRSVIRNREEVTFFGRSIPRGRLHTAYAALGFYLLTAAVGGYLLLLTEAGTGAAFEDVVFEAVSALGTVGLSRGVTGELTSLGKLLVVVLMFAGRLGPLTLGLALFSEPRDGERSGQEDQEQGGEPEDDVAV